jgi:UPF0755 protein
MKKSLALVIVFGLIIAGAVEWGLAAFEAPGPAAKQGAETIVLIKPGTHVRGIAEALYEAGVIVRPDVFSLTVRFKGKGSELKAGEYAIPSHASMHQIMDILVEGKAIEHKATVPEGLTSQMVYDLVKNNPELKGDTGAVPPEGSLLPETYLFARDETREGLIAKMQKAQAALVDKLWEKRAAGLPFKTKEEAIILASIVEKETGIASERPHIAAVFINRLRIGMRLQSDPTIIYGITRGYPIGRRIKQSEIDAATPYNTYVIAGLPPQPICNPGKDAIAAVLNPAVSKDLYFVADGTGGHVFASNPDEQAKNVAKWRRIHLRELAKPE